MVCKKCCGGEWHWKTCCCLGLENFLFPSAPVWGWSEDPGKEGSRTLLFILTMGFLFGKNTTKASFQRPEWILEARKKARGKKTLHLVVTQYTFLAWIPGQRRGSSPRERCSDFSLRHSTAWSWEFLCAVPTPTCPQNQVTLGSSLAFYPEHR